MSTSRREVLAAGVRLAVAAAAAGSAAAFVTPVRAARAERLSATPLAPGLTLLAGAGANVVAMQGIDDILMVDGGTAQASRALIAAVRKATGRRRIATLFNTHWHPAQTGSNEAVGREGGRIVAHEITRLYLARAVASVDYEGLYGPLPAPARPTLTTRTTGALDFAGQRIDYGYLPAAHTNGDLFVHFPERGVLVAGGPVCSDRWPVLDWRNGAWLGGLVKAHETLVGLSRPGTRIVPATGEPLDHDALVAQHALFADFHQRMVGFQNKGMDIGDILAAKPLQAHEARYGDASAFIDGAFRSLNLAYSPD